MEKEDERICSDKEIDENKIDEVKMEDLEENNKNLERDFDDSVNYDNYENEDNLEESSEFSDSIIKNNDKLLEDDVEAKIDDEAELDDEIEDEEQPEAEIDNDKKVNDKDEEQETEVQMNLDKNEDGSVNLNSMEQNLATRITTKRRRKPTARMEMIKISQTTIRSRTREKRSKNNKYNVKYDKSDTGLIKNEENINKPALSLSSSATDPTVTATTTAAATVTAIVTAAATAAAEELATSVTTAVAATIMTSNLTNNSMNTVTQKKNRKRRDSSTSSEEERWLNAIESGKLEEVEVAELRKMKDPKLMTARQRAIYDRNHEIESSLTKVITAKSFDIESGGSGCGAGENSSNFDTTANKIESDYLKETTLMALPTLSTNVKDKERPMTSEELQKAALKIQRRKQQADEKREKDKKKTMERLLKKQETKQRSGARPKARHNDNTVPLIKYCNNSQGVTIQFPPDYKVPLVTQTVGAPPPVKLCAVEGCNQPKKYNCSKTNLPLCSLECYRKNVQLSKNIIC